MKHETETIDGNEYPTPGKWSVNWVEGEVISWRHDDVEHKRIYDGPTAHVFVTHDDPFAPPTYSVEVNGDTVAEIEQNDADRDDVFDQIGDVLEQADPRSDT